MKLDNSCRSSRHKTSSVPLKLRQSDIALLGFRITVRKIRHARCEDETTYCRERYRDRWHKPSHRLRSFDLDRDERAQFNCAIPILVKTKPYRWEKSCPWGTRTSYLCTFPLGHTWRPLRVCKPELRVRKSTGLCNRGCLRDHRLLRT